MTGDFDSTGHSLNRKPDSNGIGTSEKASGSFPPSYRTQGRPVASGSKKCKWCEELVDPEKCFAMYTGVGLICEICGKDVTGWDK
jgi:hypothetical protein